MRAAATSLFAIAILAGSALSALAQTGGGASSMPGTAGINPGSVSRETSGGAMNKDTGNAGAAGTAYTGASNRDTTKNPLGTDPLSSGSTNATSRKGEQPAGSTGR